MLDPALLKENIEILKLNISRRNLDVDIDLLIELNEERKKLRFEAEQNVLTKKSLVKKLPTPIKKKKKLY